MKKLTLLVLLAFFSTLLVSAKRVGVYCFFSDTKTNLYEDETIKVYASYKDNQLDVTLQNKTGQIVFIDKANSFIYMNGIPTSLFTNSIHTTGITESKGSSVNLGSIAGAFGVRGAIGTALSGVNVGGGTSIQNTTTTYEQRIIALAPLASGTLYSIKAELRDSLKKDIINTGKESAGMFLQGGKDGYFIDKVTGKKDKFDIGDICHYQQESTPFEAKCSITYSTNEQFTDSKLITVSHYTSDIVIDNFKGAKGNKKAAKIYLPHCAPYIAKNMDCYKFITGRNVAGLVGGIIYWTFIGGGIIFTVYAIAAGPIA